MRESEDRQLTYLPSSLRLQVFVNGIDVSILTSVIMRESEDATEVRRRKVSVK